MASSAPNIAEYSVSELSGALKRSVEDQFGHVRVRGEISQFKRAASGHCYFRLKDENANLDAIVWRGVAGRLAMQPEDGLEVIATGKVTTYAQRSSYQIVIEDMTPAGKGALMALLEERRKKLAAEGLFEAERKRAIPFLPEVIGVVTSPTGAVIRDILHRLEDRFPRHVLLWPVAVQGEAAAGQIAAAIRGFNALPEDWPKPDVLIVARGGGSLEDLWAFNEEEVVRAVAECSIPVISAVGHETDTTLIDFVSDRRAPTPTAAAEMAVPVRADLLFTVQELAARQDRALSRMLDQRAEQVRGLARGLPKPEEVLAQKEQRLDDVYGRLATVGQSIFSAAQARQVSMEGRFQPRLITAMTDRLGERMGDLSGRHSRSLASIVSVKQQAFSGLTQRLRIQPAQRALEDAAKALQRLSQQSESVVQEKTRREGERLSALGRMLSSLSYQGTLARGYALVRSAGGDVICAAKDVKAGTALSIEFADGHISAAATASPTAPKKPAQPKPAPKQGNLF
ncbi:MAG: exodeoxyribonuclease VII large subunit [Pseudomonadota bacterium]